MNRNTANCRISIIKELPFAQCIIRIVNYNGTKEESWTYKCETGGMTIQGPMKARAT